MELALLRRKIRVKYQDVWTRDVGHAEAANTHLRR